MHYYHKFVEETGVGLCITYTIIWVHYIICVHINAYISYMIIYNIPIHNICMDIRLKYIERIRGEKRTVGGASINLVGTQKQRVYIINPINRKVNYMHSKRSFPSSSKLRDLFSRIYTHHHHIIYIYALADPAALNSKLCIGGPIPSYVVFEISVVFIMCINIII